MSIAELKIELINRIANLEDVAVMEQIKQLLDLEEDHSALTALEEPFELQTANLPEHVMRSIEKSSEQFNDGNSISLQTFKEKHFRRNQ